MWQRNNLFVRIAGPTILVSTLLLGLCGTAAVLLYRQQVTSAEVLGENVSSSQLAHDLENTLNDLVSLLRDRNDQVAPLHQRVRRQLGQAWQLADKDEEMKLVKQMEESFERYLQNWEARLNTAPEARDSAIIAAIRVMESETVPACNRLQEFNARQIKESAQAHSIAVRWMVLGLVGVGTLGSLAGVFLGYGVARRLQHSIHRLSIRVRDAADLLGQDLPPVVITEGDGLASLQKQMQGVTREIEQVVERLQQREREVLRAEQLAAVGQLAAGLAHELRNPLTSIKMLFQTLSEEARDRDLPAEDLHIIELELRRMERCLQTFLDFARPNKLECRLLDLTGLVEQTLALIGTRARKQQVSIRFQRPEQPVLAQVDGDHIKQLLINLGLNALDVMPQGGTLSVDLHAREHDHIELRVLDSGPGIAPEMLPRLFRPFVSTKETGLGLGLVVSQRIAESHGGTLRAANRPEGGACFTLRLPAAKLSPVPQNEAPLVARGR